MMMKIISADHAARRSGVLAPVGEQRAEISVPVLQGAIISTSNLILSPMSDAIIATGSTLPEIQMHVSSQRRYRGSVRSYFQCFGVFF